MEIDGWLQIPLVKRLPFESDGYCPVGLEDAASRFEAFEMAESFFRQRILHVGTAAFFIIIEVSEDVQPCVPCNVLYKGGK